MNKKAVVIISGGLDSSTLMYDVVAQYGKDNVYGLSFDYGQKHKFELKQATLTCIKLGVEHQILDLEVLNKVAPSALTRKDWKVPVGHYAEESMKQTVVPNRNMIMLSLATAFAIGKGAKFLYYGAHSGDHCITSDELVFTSKGKISIEDLQVGDYILSQNLKEGGISFRKVLKKVDNGIREDILEVFTLGGKSFKVTNNHRVFKINRHSFNQQKGWKKELKEVKAEELKKGDFVLTATANGGLWKENDSLNYKIDLLPYCNHEYKASKLNWNEDKIWLVENNKVNRFVSKESFIKLLAWYITEGSYGSGKEKRANSFRVEISQSKLLNNDNYQEIIKLVKDWGFHATTCKSAIYFSGPTTNIFKLCGVDSYNKKIPLEFLNLFPSELFFTLLKGDGCKLKENNYCYTTVSSFLKEQVCWLALILGYSANIHVLTNGCFNIQLSTKFKKQSNMFKGSKLVKIVNIIKSKPFQVYDIEVEGNHNFFAGKGSGVLVSNSIYPDCRPEFIEVMKKAIELADWNKVELCAPYGNLNKITILEKGLKLGVDYNLTHTCYNPNEKGESCGKCGSCFERLEAFEKNGIKDPLVYYK